MQRRHDECTDCGETMVERDRMAPPYMDAEDERISKQLVLKCVNKKCPTNLRWKSGYCVVCGAKEFRYRERRCHECRKPIDRFSRDYQAGLLRAAELAKQHGDNPLPIGKEYRVDEARNIEAEIQGLAWCSLPGERNGGAEMTKHTPGPTLEEDIQHIKKAGWAKCCLETLTRIVAKARSAPDLLEAAEEMLLEMEPDHLHFYDETVTKLEKAIRKAKGND